MRYFLNGRTICRERRTRQSDAIGKTQRGCDSCTSLSAQLFALSALFACSLRAPTVSGRPAMDDWVHDFQDDDMHIFDRAEEPLSEVSATAASATPASATPGSAASAAAASASVLPRAPTSAASASANPPAPTGSVAAGKKRALKRKASQPTASQPTVRKTRFLKRRPSLGKPSGLQCMDRLCLWGDKVRVPCVIHPLVRRSGRVFFPVSERSYWLRRACGDKGMTHWTESFQRAVSELRRTLKDGIRETVDRAQAAVEKARDALGLQEEDGAQASAVGAKTRRKKGAASAPGAQSIDDVGVVVNRVLVKVRVRERPYEIEATPEAVMAVVGFCQTSLQRGKAALRRESRTSASRVGFAFEAEDCPAIIGKVTWHPSVEAWCVHYKDAQRQNQWRRVTAKSHERKDSFLEAFAEERGRCASKAARRMAYLAALRLWNDVDCSTRDRIELPMSASASMEEVMSEPASASCAKVRVQSASAHSKK